MSTCGVAGLTHPQSVLPTLRQIVPMPPPTSLAPRLPPLGGPPVLEFVGRPVSRAAAASGDGTAGHTFTLRPPTARVPSSTMYGGGAGGEGKAAGGSRAAGSASNGMPLAAARVLVTWKPWEDEEKGRYQPVKVRVRAEAEEEGGEGRGEERTRGSGEATVARDGQGCARGLIKAPGRGDRWEAGASGATMSVKLHG